MTVILGIDAAWTAAQPSGVAVLRDGTSGWELVAVASSYARFLALGAGERSSIGPGVGELPDAGALLDQARVLAGAPADLIAVDMPMSLSEIKSRRRADDEISRAYGGRGAGTHSPSAIRPGAIGVRLTNGFRERGFPLRVGPALVQPGLIEVYPHPALIELAKAKERLRYKISRIRRYWKDRPVEERREALLAEWRGILRHLDGEISAVSAAIVLPAPGSSVATLKATEDALDAVVCAWVGMTAVQGAAKAYGDETAAIWAPLPNLR